MQRAPDDVEDGCHRRPDSLRRGQGSQTDHG
jgi:hypothetical protein